MKVKAFVETISSRAGQSRVNRRVALAIVFVLTTGLCLPGAHKAQVRKSARPEKKETTKGKTPSKAPKRPARKGPPTDITNAANFVLIEPGEFMMGSENASSVEKPVHLVRITRPFEMGKYEVTQAQWQAVMGNNPSHSRGANLPVEQVSWDDAQEFIKKLNAMNDGYTYRLPTEAEWEYACKTGTGDLDAMAWFRSTSDEIHPVGTNEPNAWGLYDMHENVWEWCQDWFDANYYAQSPNVDPQGPSPGLLRVKRGGGWGSFARDCRSAFRDGIVPDNRGDVLGFRLVRTLR
ncbi:MAG: formylglycine-generating enzyme family protein [Blastocatellia bacterium]|nr:formylglycine-generating enzyme family protein [Blastocatellia bacterium]